MHFSVITKILPGVAVVLLVGLITMLVILDGLRTVKLALREVAEVEEPTSAAAYEMEINVIGTGLGVVGYLETGAPHYRKRAQEDTADFLKFKAQYDRLAETPKGKELGSRLGVLFNEFMILGATLTDQKDRHRAMVAGLAKPAGKERRSLEHAMRTNFTRFLALRDEMDHVLDNEIQTLALTDLNAAKREAERASVHVIQVLTVLIPLFTLLGVGGGILLVRVSTKPLKVLMEGTAAVGRGDLSHRIVITSHDEFGDLAKQFNQMVAQLEADERTLKTTNAALGQEITVRKHAEETLARYAAELERSNQELQDFASIASHDLQEPLRKIMAFGDRLRTHYAGALDKQGQDYLTRMQNAAERMRMLTERLLDLSKVTSQASHFKATTLAEVVAEVLVDLEARIQETRGRVEVGPLPVLHADPLQMRQVFQNLLANALKFHKAGEPPVVTVHGRPAEHGCWEITVADNGIGFDEKYLDRIFRPFQRLHGRHEFEGSGMGLAICRKIVMRHRGTITARSEPGKGSAFIITLPAHPCVNEGG